MPGTMNIGAATGYNAGGAITKKRFVKYDNTATDGETVIQCDTLGELAMGVALFSVSTAEITLGKGASVITDGRAILTAGEALNNGDLVMAGADGKAYKATAGNYILGMVDEPASGADVDCTVNVEFAGAKA